MQYFTSVRSLPSAPNTRTSAAPTRCESSTVVIFVSATQAASSLSSICARHALDLRGGAVPHLHQRAHATHTARRGELLREAGAKVAARLGTRRRAGAPAVPGERSEGRERGAEHTYAVREAWASPASWVRERKSAGRCYHVRLPGNRFEERGCADGEETHDGSSDTNASGRVGVADLDPSRSLGPRLQQIRHRSTRRRRTASCWAFHFASKARSHTFARVC